MRRKRILLQKRPAAGGEARERASFSFHRKECPMTKMLRVGSVSYTHLDVYKRQVENGCDIIDTAMSPLALGTSQPATEVMVETFKGTPYDTGLSQRCV